MSSAQTVEPANQPIPNDQLERLCLNLLREIQDVIDYGDAMAKEVALGIQYRAFTRSETEDNAGT